MNRVQFQPGLSMVESMQRYGSDELCKAALILVRWPHGFVCPDCGMVNGVARDFGTLYADETARKSLEARFSASSVQSSPAQFAREYAEEANVWKNTFAMLPIAPE